MRTERAHLASNPESLSDHAGELVQYFSQIAAGFPLRQHRRHEDPRVEQRYTVRGDVRLWDAETGKLRGAPRSVPQIAEALAFGDGGKVLAVGGSRVPPGYSGGPGEITVWDVTPGAAP